MNTMRKFYVSAATVMIVAGSLLVGTGTAHAAITAYQVDPGSLPVAGNQNWSGTVGMDFTVIHPIVVYALGAFDSSQDGLNRAINVELWERNSAPSVIASKTFPTGAPGTLEGAYRFYDLASPLLLGPGDYTISGENYGATELLGNDNFSNYNISRDTNDGGGAISFSTTSRFNNNGDLTSFPSHPGQYGTSNQQYNWLAGNFKYAPTPEPGTLLLIGSGLAGIGVGARRRKRK